MRLNPANNSRNWPQRRQVLDCGSPLPLSGWDTTDGNLQKRQRTGAVQDAGATTAGAPLRSCSHGAFTLVEMLVVILLIAVLAAVSMPFLKGFNRSGAMDAAIRQMLDDVAYARHRAISGHTTVYMVFLPPQFWSSPATNQAAFNTLTTLGGVSYTNAMELISGQSAAYALFTLRSIGDQPGHPYARYLTAWRRLPEGILIETNKFSATEIIMGLNLPPRSGTNFVFPTNAFYFPAQEASNTTHIQFILPYLAFDSQGRLVSQTNNGNFADEYIPLAHGSIMVPEDDTGLPLPPAQQPADAIQIQNYREPTRTNYNLIHIDWLTGRAKVERWELQ